MHPYQETIHIVTTLDSNYVQHCGVMLCSLFKNNLECKFKIWLVVDFDENRDLKKIRKFITKNKHILEIIKIDGSVVKDFRITHHITTATYYRILFPALVDAALDRIIYLDIDIIVKGPILPLWKVAINNSVIAAVAEYGFSRYSELEIDQNSKYFNAGVMLVNLEQWRRQNITTSLLNLLIERHQNLTMLEQDALNLVLRNEWRELDPKWNVTTGMYAFYSSTMEEEIKMGVNNPSIIHFTGFSKPWHYLNSHPKKMEYYYYLQFTPWQSFKPEETTYWHKLKQKLKNQINILFRTKIFEIYN
jgi:lipopolysaccharide biosynthesis glycosyltransferase